MALLSAYSRMCAPTLASTVKAWSHEGSAVMVMVTCTPRRAAAARALATAGSSISSSSTARVCLAAAMTDKMDVSAFEGDHTRSVPSGGTTGRPVKSALKVATMAATSARLVSITPKSRVPG